MVIALPVSTYRHDNGNGRADGTGNRLYRCEEESSYVQETATSIDAQRV